MHCYIKNGTERANGTFVLLKSTEAVGFSSGHDEIWMPSSPPAFELILDSFHSSLEIRLSLSTISRTVYIHVFISARIEWKHSVSLFLSLSRVVSPRPPSHLTEWHFSRLVSRSLRLITIYYARYRAESRITRPRNFARISVGLSRQTDALERTFSRTLPLIRIYDERALSPAKFSREFCAK